MGIESGHNGGENEREKRPPESSGGLGELFRRRQPAEDSPSPKETPQIGPRHSKEKGKESPLRFPRQLWATTRMIKEQSELSREQFLERHGEEIKAAFTHDPEVKPVPVLICAYNEAKNIGRTLYALSQSEIPLAPLVIDNGSTDDTAEIAATLGARVVKEEQRGMLHALRKGFTVFKEMNYKGPILHTDADAVPLPTWAPTMVNHLETTMPDGGEAFGRVFHYDYDEDGSHAVKNVIYTAGAATLEKRSALKGEARVRINNGAIMTDADGRILDALSQLSPGDKPQFDVDEQIRDIVASQGGEINACRNTKAFVVVSGRRYPNLTDVARVIVNKDAAKRRAYKDWGKNNS